MSGAPAIPRPRPAPLGRSRAGAAPDLRAADLALAAITLLGLALRLYQLARPGYLHGVTEYDDAVDFGSAVRLVHGVLPYRDFVLVQPPGISLLLSPVAWLTSSSGTATGFAVARVLTACASAATIPLAGLLVRHRGPRAVIIAAGVAAVHPEAVDAAHTVLLEPWLVLFCLLGAWVLFSGDDLVERPRLLLLGGALLGFAGAVKVWAVLPVLALLVLCIGRLTWRGRGSYVGGVALGFGLPVLPFLLIAPSAFYRNIVVAQLTRVDASRVALWFRLRSLDGLSLIGKVRPGVAVAVAVAIALVVGVSLAVRAWRAAAGPDALERFVLGTTVLALLAFLWPADYYGHYAAFFAPFLGLTVALALTAPAHGGRRLRGPVPVPAAALAAVAAVAVVAGAALVFAHLRTLHAGDPAASIDRRIPAGACVVTDLPSLTIVANRFTSNVAGCPEMIDPVGTDYALSDGRNGVSGAGRYASVRRAWLTALARAQYVWLQCSPPAARSCDRWTNRRIPWIPPILGYFRRTFRPLPGERAPAHVFERRA